MECIQPILKRWEKRCKNIMCKPGFTTSVSVVRTRSCRSWSVAAARGPCGSARHTWRRLRSPASPAPHPSPQSVPPSTQHNQMESIKKGKEGGVIICCIRQLLLFNANFFLKKKRRTPVLLVGPLILLFWTLVTLPWFSKPGWIPLLACFIACAQWNPQNHLWCGICWPLGDQHGGWAILIHLLANKH